MRYVCSDIHGCFDKFIKMIKKINFKDTDELYILGDIFDRGDNPLGILDYIVSHKNIFLLKGNHEQLFIDYFETGDAKLWFYNGGETTLNQINRRSYDYEHSLYSYIRKLPTIKVIDNFILVHAQLYLPKNFKKINIEELLEIQEDDINLWNRDYLHSNTKYKNYKIICGHTPVQCINNNDENVNIIHRKGHIFIDCGCCFEEANGKLACLCLDNMEEFYI